MVRIFFSFLILFSFLISEGQESVKFMSFNIRYASTGDGEDIWEYRMEGLANFIGEEEADFIGLQEALEHQLKYLKGFLLDYDHLGVGREDGIAAGEFSPILYNPNKWKLIESKNLWLSETPDTVSKGWDASFERVVTYGLFSHKSTGDSVAVFNTHFDHRGEKARKGSAELVAKWAAEFTNIKNRAVLGDFNLEPHDPLYDILTGTLMDSRTISPSVYEDHKGTFNGFKLEGEFDRRIDYIFVWPGMKVLSYSCPDIRINGRHVSDHFSIIVETEL